MAKRLLGLFVVLALCFAQVIPAAALVTDSLTDLQEALDTAAVGGVVVLEDGTVELKTDDALVVPAGVTLIVSGGGRIDINGGALEIADGGTFLLLAGGTLCIKTGYAVYIGTEVASAVMDISEGNLINDYGTVGNIIIFNKGELYILDGQFAFTLSSFDGALFVTYANYDEVNAALALADEVDRALYTEESLAVLDEAIDAVEWDIIARYETGLPGRYDNREAVREQITKWANDILDAIAALVKIQPVDDAVVDASASAYVVKLNGNKNDLYITITEKLYNGEVRVLDPMKFSINNNAAGTYSVGPYKVYVDTKGNVQVREIYITNLAEALGI